MNRLKKGTWHGMLGIYKKRLIQWKDGMESRKLFAHLLVSRDFVGETLCNKFFVEEEYVRNTQDAYILIQNLEHERETRYKFCPFILNPDVDTVMETTY